MKTFKRILVFIFKPSVFNIGLILTLLFMILAVIKEVSRSPYLEFIDTIERKYLDFRFQNRGAIKPGDEVAIAAIDEKSVQTIGRWPWPRSRIGELITALKKYGAKVVSFDAIFSEEDPNKITPQLKKVKEKYLSINKKGNQEFLKYMDDISTNADTDLKLADAIKNAAENVVLGFVFFTDDSEVAGIDKATFANHVKNIENSSLKLVSVPQPEELPPNPVVAFSMPVGLISNLKIFSENTPNHAFFNALPDPDGPIRKSFLIMPYGEQFFPSLTFKSVMTYLEAEPFLKINYSQTVQALAVEKLFFVCISPEDLKDNPERMKKIARFVCPKKSDGSINEEAKLEIPTDESGRFLINYRGNAKTFPHYSIADIIDKKDTIEAAYDSGMKTVTKAEAFKDKIILVGATAIGIMDLRNTPFSSVFPGVEIHANVIDNILRGDFLVRPAEMLVKELIAMLIAGIILSLAFIKLSALISALLTVGILALYWFLDKTFLFPSGVWAHVVLPVIQVLGIYFSTNLFKYMTEERQKKQIKGAFQQYVAKEVVNEMLKDPKKLQLGGSKMDVTLMFSDIRSFSTISEGLEPLELSRFLNLYLTPMTDIIIENLGTIDKYMGDAIMAVFGAPVPKANHPLLASKAAIQMIRSLLRLRDDWKKSNFPESIYTLNIGIGLNSGPCTVGNMGSTQIFDYTSIGDNVNLASRLEGLNKEYKTHVLVSEYTYERIKNDVPGRIIDLVTVKGKTLPVSIYQLLCDENIDQKIKDKIGFYTEAFGLYKKQEWDKAIDLFEKADKAAGDPTAIMMAKRCHHYKEESPGKDWTGVHVMKTK